MNENRTKIERESSKKRIYNLLVYRVTIHSNKYDFTRHKTTRKHLNRTKTQNIEQTALDDIAPLICKNVSTKMKTHM
mgnify:CR=1 FL=1